MLGNRRTIRRIKVAADENPSQRTSSIPSSTLASAKAVVQSVQAAAGRSALGDLSNARKAAGIKSGKEKIVGSNTEKPAAVAPNAHRRAGSAVVSQTTTTRQSRHSISARPAVRPGRSLSAVIAGATRSLTGAPVRPLPSRARSSVIPTKTSRIATVSREDVMEICEDGGNDTEPEDEQDVAEMMAEVDDIDVERSPIEEPPQVYSEPEPEVDEDDWTMASPVTNSRYAAVLDQVRSTFKDEIDEWDMTMVSEYSDEIFAYMGRLEVESMANATYMDGQTEIQWHMRRTLVDWLLQVHLRYHMLPETLWIAVNIVDRFLSKRVVSLVKLQLVGVTAMFIAAKYEEIMAPSVDEFAYMTENGYTRDEILKGERIVLTTLDFNISSYCSPYSWVRKISKADDYDIQTRTLCKFLMEVTLLDHRFLRARPSMLAAIGMYTSKRMLGGAWDDAFIYYSDYVEEQLIPGFELMIENLIEPGFEQQYVYRKYANKKFLKASIFAREWSLNLAENAKKL